MGRPPPTALHDARIELHYAAQVVSACADARLPARPDDSHTAMRWSRPRMLGEPAPDGVAIGLDCEAFAIVSLGGAAGEQLFPLAGKSLAEALRWADERHGAPAGAHLRDYDLPASPLRDGSARFAGHPAELAELVRWYQLGQEVLSTVAGAGDLLVWPHHFDLGAIVDGVGVGLSPGDRYYDEPYFYVTPRTGDTRVPVLPLGLWRTDLWSGAVLTATEVGDDPRRAHDFMSAAVAGLR